MVSPQRRARGSPPLLAMADVMSAHPAKPTVASQGPAMSHLFTTELLPVADRIDAWRSNAQQICGDCRIQLPKTSFHGSIEVRSVGGLNLTRFSSSPLSFWKWPADVLRDDNRSCIVITQLSGVRQYLQNGMSVLLRPGDSTVIDAGRPWCS